MSIILAATIAITEWRTKFQRRMNLADNAQKARSVDSLLNFETVKYYGAEAYEVESYKKSIFDFQTQEWASMITSNILNTLQNIIISGGLLCGSLLCLHMVSACAKIITSNIIIFNNIDKTYKFIYRLYSIKV